LPAWAKENGASVTKAEWAVYAVLTILGIISIPLTAVGIIPVF
jgi:arginine:ornithine antiporter/lysine permease